MPEGFLRAKVLQALVKVGDPAFDAEGVDAGEPVFGAGFVTFDGFLDYFFGIDGDLPRKALLPW